MNFNMRMEETVVSFVDEASGVSVFVNSDDNVAFLVRIGTEMDTQPAGVIVPTTHEELNEKLNEIWDAYKHIHAL